MLAALIRAKFPHYSVAQYHPDAQPAGDVTTLLNYLQGTAVQYRDIGVTAKDQIIGLSTCSEAVTNGRVVLFGRLDK